MFLVLYDFQASRVIGFDDFFISSKLGVAMHNGFSLQFIMPRPPP